jgi:hypothetical protein
MSSNAATLPPNPLASGNALQRAYYRWAQRYYERLDPHKRAEVEAIDAYLYTRRSLGLWLGLLGAWAGMSLGFVGLGMPWLFAVGLAFIGVAAISFMVLSAWLMPGKYLSAAGRKALLVSLVLGPLGGILGFIAGDVQKRGSFEPQALALRMWESAGVFVPAVVITALTMAGLAWMVARVRRELLEREQARLQLERERDQATAAAAQARLSVLQAQIRPHFLFNTLATLQHWVDQGDSRAGALLAELTGFLRGSTEAFDKPHQSVAEEAHQAQRYLRIMQARLGPRLQFELRLSPEAAAQPLPPALLLTLVENAIEHGIEPALAGGRIELHAQALADAFELSLRDTGAGLPAGAAPAEGIGLANSRQRLQALHGPKASLHIGPAEGGGTQVLLRWPRHPAAGVQAGPSA